MSGNNKDDSTINTLRSDEEEEKEYRWYLRESARIRRERPRQRNITGYSPGLDEEIILVR